MADTNINLFESTGAITPANFNSDISIACDVQVSPGTFITKKIPGDVLKNTLTSYITNLSTASFINIQSSFDFLNNAIIDNDGAIAPGLGTVILYAHNIPAIVPVNDSVMLYKFKVATRDYDNDLPYSSNFKNTGYVEILVAISQLTSGIFVMDTPVTVISKQLNSTTPLPAITVTVTSGGGGSTNINFALNQSTWGRSYSYRLEYESKPMNFL